MSVVGFNDMPFIHRVSPPLTSVRVPHYEIGAEAARLLLEVLEDAERHPRSLLLPLTLTVRGSTAPPRPLTPVPPPDRAAPDRRRLPSRGDRPAERERG